jgi:DNA-binding transcriptional MocR family regulator
MARRGVAISSSATAFVGGGAPHLHGFRVAFAYLSEDRMRTALTILADACAAVRE